jgi:hypothetical protein
MSEKNQEQLEQQTVVGNSNKEEKKSGDWWIKILAAATVAYVAFSLVSPMFLKENQRPRKIETSDLVLIAIVFLFGSGLIDRLEGLGISKEGGLTAQFKRLEADVGEQQRQIDALQAKQLEDHSSQLQKLAQQQKNLAKTQETLKQTQEDLKKTQAFMYNLMLSEMDYEKIHQLFRHSEEKTPYEFRVSRAVGDELRRLRDLDLIKLRSGSVSNLVRASDDGKRSIDLTNYFFVTKHGREFLTYRKQLCSTNQLEEENSEEGFTT